MRAKETGGFGLYARFAYDRVCLAYADPDNERHGDTWDLRVFGRSGRLDFSGIRQEWLRQAAKAWTSAAMVRLRSKNMLQHRVQAVAAMSRVLAAGPGGGADPAGLGRLDVDRFLVRVASLRNPETGQPYTARRAGQIVEDCACVLREVREMGLLADLGPTFVFRRGDFGRHGDDEEQAGRALPPHVVAQLDAHLDLLAQVPGSSSRPGFALGVLGDHAGQMAVLTYKLLLPDVGPVLACGHRVVAPRIASAFEAVPGPRGGASLHHPPPPATAPPRSPYSPAPEHGGS